VTEQGAAERGVYLPPTERWYDFWTGKPISGDRRFAAAASIERIPLYVRAGSIVPMGPEIEYAAEKPDLPVELRIYRGANGHFDLYEDQGDSYDYERGERAVIPIDWNESAQTLTLGARDGSYPGMAPQRRFDIVFVGENHGAGGTITAVPDRSVEYSGSAVTINAR
jgi:alpha-D-xyloside xylohydrolase